jgi:hypothetical protein
MFRRRREATPRPPNPTSHERIADALEALDVRLAGSRSQPDTKG